MNGFGTARPRRERGGLLQRFSHLEETSDGSVDVHCRTGEGPDRRSFVLSAKSVVGADGANSAVAKQALTNQKRPPCVFAYHEIISKPELGTVANYDPERCDVIYQGRISPDFYGWVFPHGETASVGVGSAQKGYPLRRAVASLRSNSGLEDTETIRCEGAPIPLKPLRRWDNGKNVIVAGDAAGVVAPASGEGIYYAMYSGELTAAAMDTFLATGNPKALTTARKAFMRRHGRIFLILRIMQHFWYRSEERRERFVSMCRDPDVQRLTWQSYMHKELVRSKLSSQVRIFFKDLAHLLRVRAPST